MSTYDDAVARLIGAGLDDETASKIATELVPAPAADPMRTFTESLFGGNDPAEPKRLPGHVAREGGNPTPLIDDTEMRDFTRGLFGRND